MSEPMPADVLAPCEGVDVDGVDEVPACARCGDVLKDWEHLEHTGRVAELAGANAKLAAVRALNPWDHDDGSGVVGWDNVLAVLGGTVTLDTMAAQDAARSAEMEAKLDALRALCADPASWSRDEFDDLWVEVADVLAILDGAKP